MWPERVRSCHRAVGATDLRSLVAVVVLLATSCMTAPSPPTAPSKAPEPAVTPTVAQAAVATPAAAAEPPAPTMVYAFTDPGRKDRLAHGLGDLQAWTEQRGRELNVAGLFVGVVVDRELVATGSYGYRDVRSKAPVDADTVFRIGSITKPITTMAVLKLRDEGKLSLDARASRYVPEFALVRAPARDSHPITIRQLLTHSSGLPREGAVLDDTDGNGTSEKALVGALKGMDLEFEPGSRYQYSNQGFSLLGVIVGRVAHQSYRDTMQAALFGPLGLTSAVWDRADVPPEHLAWPHKLDDAGNFEVDEKEEVFGAREPSGGLYISGRDFAKFLSWQLAAHPPGEESDAGILKRSSRRESHEQGRLIGLYVNPAPPQGRWVANAEANAVGLSWHGYSNCDFDYVVFHNGLVHTYASDAAFLPAYGVGVFVFANSAPTDVGRLRRELLEKLRQSGGLVAYQRRPLAAPRLDQALARLLDVYHNWDEQKYGAMLSEQHKKNITAEREQQELAEYRELHGTCRPGDIVQYTSQNVARYQLLCDKANLQMALYLNADNGLIDGFVGYSTGVEPSEPGKRAATRALALLSKWNERRFEALLAPKFNALAALEATSKDLAAYGACRLGDLLERDGNRWQRFRVTCTHGPERVLSVHLDDDDATRIDGLTLIPVRAGPCAER